MDSRTPRRRFVSGLVRGLRVIRPVVSGLVMVMIAPELLVGHLEGWRIGDSVYFAFVTGLTIGYGDFVPHSLLTRAITIGIGLSGVLLTALLAAVAVAALTNARIETET